MAAEEENPALTRNGLVVISVFVFAVCGSAWLASAWMGLLTVYPMELKENLIITNVKFVPGYVELTVRNDHQNSTLTEVWVGQPPRPERAPYRVIMNMPVPANGQISFSISYTWLSGATYQIKLITQEGSSFIQNAVAP
jgi:hypothetical protein